jgi:hypothetical protein
MLSATVVISAARAAGLPALEVLNLNALSV